MTHPRYITKIDDIKELSEDDAARLRNVEEKFPFRASEYYLSLINGRDCRIKANPKMTNQHYPNPSPNQS